MSFLYVYIQPKRIYHFPDIIQPNKLILYTFIVLYIHTRYIYVQCTVSTTYIQQAHLYNKLYSILFLIYFLCTQISFVYENGDLLVHLIYVHIYLHYVNPVVQVNFMYITSKIEVYLYKLVLQKNKNERLPRRPVEFYII